MRVGIIVILEPRWQLLEERNGACPWVHAGIATFQGFDEGLADAAAFRAADRRETWNKVQGCGEVRGFGGGIGGAIISQPLDGKRGAERVEPALDAVGHNVDDAALMSANGAPAAVRLQKLSGVSAYGTKLAI